MYAILPDDGTRGYNVGELWEIEQLRDKLTALLESGQHDGEISHLHEQLGFKWLTIPEAQELIERQTWQKIPTSTLTNACRSGHIANAIKQGRDWRFPQMSFLHWVKHRPKSGRKAKQ